MRHAPTSLRGHHFGWLGGRATFYCFLSPVSSPTPHISEVPLVVLNHIDVDLFNDYLVYLTIA